MFRSNLLKQETGSILIYAVVMLVTLSALGVTMITLGRNQVDMATNLKLKEIARYNCDSCTVATAKLIRHIADQSNEGTVGVPAGPATDAPGIAYPAPTTTDPAAVEFGKKVLFELDTGSCDDVSFASAAIGTAISTASGGAFVIDTTLDANGRPRELDAAADIRTDLASIGGGPGAGFASEEFAAGYHHGLGGGGAGGGGTEMRWLFTCRGRAPGNAVHVGHSIYRKTLGSGSGE